MALFNVTTNKVDALINLFEFKASNVNITVDDDDQLRISQLQISEDEWLNNL